MDGEVVGQVPPAAILSGRCTSPKVQAGHSTAPEKDAVDHFNAAVVEHCESTAWPKLIHGHPPCHGPRLNLFGN